ncbi:MOSC domain-containing protein [Microbispora sp. KK1-11]|uniref:MOSC domain-containing protein n=1 Tax=Microbispora sp. KK1-11 TaxID=2053005 RepID=UPI00115B6EC0|nr:MOSC domain-containing protein [Microbispora sp. KK1-11]TQS30097.1 MOSC domain-containing protein [Microbispora sp. KK1-11]
MRILSVNVGRAVDAEWAGNLRRTAIDKRKIEGRIAVRENGLAGDERADVANHGHPDQAVYAYAREDYDWWEPRMGRDLRDGQFGENLTTSGADVTGAVLGERWRVGTAVLEVTAPRVPCVVFRNWLDERGWVKRFTDANRTGAYFRVVEQGELGVGDEIEVLHRPSGSVTIAESFRAYHGDRDLMLQILSIPGHSDKWDRIAERVLGDRGGVVAS